MTNEQVMRRIRAANPVETVPRHDRELLRSILATPGDRRLVQPPMRSRTRHVHVRRYAAPVSGVLAAAAVIAVVVVAGGPAVTPASAVAAVLTRAAVAAQDQPTLRLAAGQYLYSETSGGITPVWAWGSELPNHLGTVNPDAVQIQTVQTWDGADGSARILTTDDGPQFYDPQGQSQTDSQIPAADDGPPDDLSGLPTDPAALTQLIDQGRTGLAEIGFQPSIDASSWYAQSYTFVTAVNILATPALGSSPALRTALYQVMANVAGTELLGTATDHSGRSGTEIAGPIDPKTGARVEVIIDPANGTILEQKTVLADPAEQPAAIASYVTAGYVTNWTDYLTSGVVNSTTDTPSTGTAPPAGNPGTTATTGASGPTGPT